MLLVLKNVDIETDGNIKKLKERFDFEKIKYNEAYHGEELYYSVSATFKRLESVIGKQKRIVIYYANKIRTIDISDSDKINIIFKVF